MAGPLAYRRAGPTYENWVVCLGSRQGFLASVHAEATDPLQVQEKLPNLTIVPIGSRHDTNQLHIEWWCLKAVILASHWTRQFQCRKAVGWSIDSFDMGKSLLDKVAALRLMN